MSTTEGDRAVLDWNTEPEWASEEAGVPTLAQFAEQSSLHGLSYVVGPRSCSVRRCLWTVAFCGSLSFLTYHYVTLISYYFMYPHITKLEEVAAPDMDFPAITFCNVNRARFSRLNKCDIHHIGELWSLSETAEVNLSDLVHQDHLAMLTDLHSITEQEKGNCKFDWEELYTRTAHNLWDMVKSCHFGNVECVREDFNTVSNPFLFDFNPFPYVFARGANLVCKMCENLEIYTLVSAQCEMKRHQNESQLKFHRSKVVLIHFVGPVI